jgi:hypothetical protein
MVEFAFVSRAPGKTAPVLLDPLDNIRPPLRAHSAAALSYAALPLVVQRHRACRSFAGPRGSGSPSRHPWAWRLRRVFAVDIMTCPHCQCAMRVKSIATKADEIRAVLGTVPRARPPPPLRQLELDFTAA